MLAGLRELQDEGEPDILSELIELLLTDVPTQLLPCERPRRPGMPTL